VLKLFALDQFSLLKQPWAKRATLADGAPIDPTFVCAQLERAARLAGRLRTEAHFQASAPLGTVYETLALVPDADWPAVFAAIQVPKTI